MIPALFTKEYFQQLETAEIRSRRRFLGSRQGGHLSPKKGHGLEFCDYRNYEQGDNPRHIDWNVYARSDRVVIKRFQEEESLSFLFMIDGSPSMAVDNKWGRATEILLSLAYVALGQGDVVSTMTLGSSKFERFTGKKQFAELAKQFPSTRPQVSLEEGKLLSEVMLATATLRYPGVCFFIADFFSDFSEIEKSLLALRKKNYITHVIQVLGASDLQPAAVGESGFYLDSESNERVSFTWSADDDLSYRKKLTESFDTLQRYCTSSGFLFSRFITSQQSVSQFIFDSVLPRGSLLSWG